MKRFCEIMFGVGIILALSMDANTAGIIRACTGISMITTGAVIGLKNGI